MKYVILMSENNNWKNWNFDKNVKNEKVFKESFFLTNRFKVLIIFFFITLVTLFNLKIIEVLSLADGKVIPQGRIKYIQHLEGGIVDEILVKEGDKVDSNQPLIILSKAKASSEFEEIDARLQSIDLSILRVKAEKKSLKNIPNDLTENIFDKDLVDFENELLNSRKESLNLEKKTISKNIKNFERRNNLIKEQIKISEELLKVAATNRFKHIELLRELSNIEGQLDEQKNKLQTVQINFSEQLNNELSGLNKEKSELKKRIKKYSDNLNRTILKSPVAGIVKLISVNSKGAIVAPGVTVLEIVPENEKLIVEAKLPLSEIGYIKKGLSAKIRLNSPDGSRFKPLEGSVIFVGADRVSNEQNKDFYLVKIETEQKSFLKGKENYKLYSGVPVTIGIITGKRSFFDYFFSPFKTNIFFALSER